MLTPILVTRVVAATLVMLFGIGAALSRGELRTRLVLPALALSVMAYLLAPLLARSGVAGLATLVDLADLVPLLALWTVWAVFDDERRVPVWLLGVSTVYLGGLIAVSPDFWPVGQPVLDGLQLALFALGAARLWLGRSGDLVDRRRRARFVFLSLFLLCGAGVVSLEMLLEPRVPPAVELVGMLAMTGGLVVLCLVAMPFTAVPPENRVAPPARQSPATGVSADAAQADATQADAPAGDAGALIRRLEQAMVDERLYARHSLKIGELAEHLGVADHVLRRTINGALGHRNFNRFVNEYRLDEATRRLRETPDVPVLTIALDVGFRSMSSFNAAFRERTGQSAGAWRRSPSAAD